MIAPVKGMVYDRAMKKLTTEYYRIELRKSGPGSGTLRFAFLTDLHSAEIGADNEELLSALERERPDAVLCGGDMIVGKPGMSTETARSLMKQLAEKYPVCHALGNHEYRTRIYPENYPGIYEEYTEDLRNAGVRLLDNDRQTLRLKGIPVTVWGFTMDRWYYDRWKRRILPAEEIEKAFGGQKPGKREVSILLAHNPAQMNAYFQWGADVTLCGHYHGGVWRFGKHRGLISPDFRLFPRAHGLFRKDGRNVIISAGLGEHTIPVRIHNPRELVILELSVKENGKD